MNAINQSGWKPEMGNADETTPATFTGNKALMLEEALIFEIGTAVTTGVDLANPPKVAARLGNLERYREIGLPGLSEPKPSAIIPALVVRIMRLIWASSRWGAAR